MVSEQVSYLEAGEQRLREGVEGAAFGLRLVEVELASEQLHAEQSEDDEEKEEEEQQGGNGLHGVQQGGHQIGQSCPMAEQKQGTKLRFTKGSSGDLKQSKDSFIWSKTVKNVIIYLILLFI